MFMPYTKHTHPIPKFLKVSSHYIINSSPNPHQNVSSNLQNSKQIQMKLLKVTHYGNSIYQRTCEIRDKLHTRNVSTYNGGTGIG